MDLSFILKTIFNSVEFSRQTDTDYKKMPAQNLDMYLTK